jgi:molybdopterin-guanine dinucleotide biosynthesis protein A
MPFVTVDVIERLVAILSADQQPADPQREDPQPADWQPEDPQPAPGAARPVPDSPRARSVDAALLIDAEGRRQFLAGAYRAASLTRALHELGSPDGVAVHRLVRHLTITEVVADAPVTLDCDTWEDIMFVRRTMEAP